MDEDTFDDSGSTGSPADARRYIERSKASGRAVDSSYFEINPDDAKRALKQGLAKDRMLANRRKRQSIVAGRGRKR